ncbi:MAG: hypothetical protein AAF297_07380, partial [Planctomycetota bacterium]
GPNATGQAAYGCLWWAPPSEWAAVRERTEAWYEEQEDHEGIFGDRQYGPDDIVPLICRNFSPDCWFVVLRGPLKGRLCHFCHDEWDDGADGVADSFESFFSWVIEDIERSFGGVNTFAPADTADTIPTGTEELYPIAYEHD